VLYGSELSYDSVQVPKEDNTIILTPFGSVSVIREINKLHTYKKVQLKAITLLDLIEEISTFTKIPFYEIYCQLFSF
jgi:hypothetical protein